MQSILNYKNIYFIGIGGISMAGLAIYMKTQGFVVSGSDNNLKSSSLYQKLKDNKINLYFSHSIDNIKNVDLIVYSSAIQKNNCELIYAKAHKIPIMDRAEFLGLLSKHMKCTIAISGTHGKTTTTALIGWIFYNAHLNPTIHLGGIAQNFNSNFINGSNKIFITEACEYNKSFLSLHPQYSIITNIDKDHMDCYKDEDEIKLCFSQFVNQTQIKSFYYSDNIKRTILKNQSIEYTSFGFNKENEYYIYSKKPKEFSIFKNNKLFISGNTQLIGEYNLLNILASVLIADEFNISKEIIKTSISSFMGVKRRFEYIKTIGKSDVYIDYAHHPNEIKALLNSVSKLEYEKIIVVFQPHTYSRTKALFTDFLTCFNECDELILIPTYPAREKAIIGGKSENLFKALKEKNLNVHFYKNNSSLKKYLEGFSQNKNIILLVGAGDINLLYTK